MYTPYRTYRIYCFYFNHIRSSAKNQPIFLSSFLNFTLLFTTRIKNPHSRFFRKCGFNFYELTRFSYGLKRISPYRCRRRSQTESQPCQAAGKPHIVPFRSTPLKYEFVFYFSTGPDGCQPRCRVNRKYFLNKNVKPPPRVPVQSRFPGRGFITFRFSLYFSCLFFL